MAGWNPSNGTERSFQTKIMAEINVTPMVDVMLVLLVIFMVTAPLLIAGVPVQLPKNSAQRISQPNKPVIVTLAADARLYISDEPVDAASLIPRLSALRSGEGDAVVYLRADKAIPYGEVMELLLAVSVRRATSGFRSYRRRRMPRQARRLQCHPPRLRNELGSFCIGGRCLLASTSRRLAFSFFRLRMSLTCPLCNQAAETMT